MIGHHLTLLAQTLVTSIVIHRQSKTCGTKRPSINQLTTRLFLAVPIVVLLTFVARLTTLSDEQPMGKGSEPSSNVFEFPLNQFYNK